MRICEFRVLDFSFEIFDPKSFKKKINVVQAQVKARTTVKIFETFYLSSESSHQIFVFILLLNYVFKNTEHFCKIVFFVSVFLFGILHLLFFRIQKIRKSRKITEFREYFTPYCIV